MKSVNHTNRLIVFTLDNGQVRSFEYTKKAKFWNGSSDNRPALLEPGMRVQVNMHDPVFGSDFVRSIKLIEPPTRPGKAQ